MSELSIGERQFGDVTVLDLKGKVQHGDGVLILRRRIWRLLEERKPKILLNFEEVTRLDDSALMEMKSTLIRMIEREGGEVKALHVNNIKNVSELTRLVTLLDCFDSETEAISAFR